MELVQIAAFENRCIMAGSWIGAVDISHPDFGVEKTTIEKPPINVNILYLQQIMVDQSL